MRPYNICHMMASLDGRIDCDMTEQIGLGSKQYTLIDLDQQSGINGTTTNDAHRYNVYSLDGKKLLSNAHNLKGLAKGTYIVNGEKVIIQ